MDFTGKVVWITGGLGGIGFSTARLYEKAGAIVVAADLRSRISGAIQRMAGHETIYESRLDIEDERNVAALADQIVERFGAIDVLVNNAGITRNAAPFEDIPMENWKKMFSINTFGAVNCTKTVIPHMKARKSGKILFVSSLAAEVGGVRTEVSYAASKAANLCMMMSLAKYLGPWNIHVNGVAPGVIDTEMTRELDPVDLKTIPLRRIGTGEDVGQTILFLTSKEADYLTGVMVDVNGGMHFR